MGLTKSVRVTYSSNIDPPLGEYYHSFCFQKRHVPFRACWQGWMENQYPSALISRVQFVISYLCAWLIRRWPTLFPRQKSTKRTGSKLIIASGESAPLQEGKFVLRRSHWCRTHPTFILKLSVMVFWRIRSLSYDWYASSETMWVLYILYSCLETPLSKMKAVCAWLRM